MKTSNESVCLVSRLVRSQCMRIRIIIELNLRILFDNTVYIRHHSYKLKNNFINGNQNEDKILCGARSSVNVRNEPLNESTHSYDLNVLNILISYTSADYHFLWAILCQRLHLDVYLDSTLFLLVSLLLYLILSHSISFYRPLSLSLSISSSLLPALVSVVSVCQSLSLYLVVCRSYFLVVHINFH